MAEEKDVIEQEPSPVQDVEVDSSTTEVEEPEEQVSDTTETKSEPEQQVPYDRFQEVNEDRKYWQEQYTQLAGKQQLPQSTVPRTDPYAGMDAQTKVFYQELDQRIEDKSQKLLTEKEKQYQAQLEALQVSNARLQEKLFRDEQKDVEPGSKEEREVAQYISMGLTPERAAMAVMGSKRIENAKTEGVKKKQNKIIQKQRANNETSSIPSNNPLPTGDKLSFEEDLERRMEKEGL